MILDGKWTLERKLGKGGMGTVWLAMDVDLERQVAIKMLHSRFAADAGLVARFDREARMMARLDHPNLVPIYAVGRQDGVPFIVMKLLEGVTLGAHLKHQGPLPLDEVAAIIRPLCLGLQFIHQRGVVHRDIKPANIFLAPDGHVTLLDLGVARDAQSEMTMAGAMVGTPRYMSPEQVLGKRADHRSDLYALAALTYELATGIPPFDGESGVSLLKAHLDTPPPDASQVARLPQAFGAMLMKGLAKKPEDRFQSASDFSHALEEAARDPLPPKATPTAIHELAVTETAHWAVVEETQLIPAPTPPTSRYPSVKALAPPRRGWLVPAGVGVVTVGGLLLYALVASRGDQAGSAQQTDAIAQPQAGATAPGPAEREPLPEAARTPEPSLVAQAGREPAALTVTPTEPARAPRSDGATRRRGAKEPQGEQAAKKTESLSVERAVEPVKEPVKEPVREPPREVPKAKAVETSPAAGPRPSRLAFSGKLLSEAETERYWAARDRGVAQAEAMQLAVAKPEAVSSPPAQPSAPLRPVAYNGHLLNDAQSRRYFAARDAGLDHEAAARSAVQEPRPPPPAPAKPLYQGPLPPNLPKRVSINGKLLSIEETERYYREKLARTPP